MKKTLYILLITVCAFVSSAKAEVAPEKRKEIQKMLQLTGMEKMTTQIVSQMIATFKTQSPEISEAFWEKFEKKLDTRQMIEKIIPIYDKYYTLEDLKAVNAFYESTAGQKILASMPQVMQEAMKVGQEWGEQAGKTAAEEIEKEKKKTKNLE